MSPHLTGVSHTPTQQSSFGVLSKTFMINNNINISKTLKNMKGLNQETVTKLFSSVKDGVLPQISKEQNFREERAFQYGNHEFC